MINPYEAPQSDLSAILPVAVSRVQRISEVPSWWWIVGLSSLTLLPLFYLFYAAIPDFYAIYFDQSLIPKNARGPGYLANYFALPLIAIWIAAQLRFLISRGKRAGKGLAIFYCLCAGMMLMSVFEGVGYLMGLIEPSPDSPPRADSSMGWFLLIVCSVVAYFGILAFSHWRVSLFYYDPKTTS